jgi:hypothetical protein
MQPKHVSAYTPLIQYKYDPIIKNWIPVTPELLIKLTSTRLPTNIDVISYNVWFSQYEQEKRMYALCDIISQKMPHLIALQEITHTSLEILLEQQWVRDHYYVSDASGDEIKFTGYGVMVLSRIPFQELYVRNFNRRPSYSKMGRKAIYGLIPVYNSRFPLFFGTFHLESNSGDDSIRCSQIEVYNDLVKNSDVSYVILCGDTNFASDTERLKFANDGGLLDTWRFLYQNTTHKTEDEKMTTTNLINPGITFDIELNPMTTIEAKEAGKKIIHDSSRLDRFFFSANTIIPIKMQLLGTETFDQENEDLRPSDHYGIYSQYQLRQFKTESTLLSSSKNDNGEEIKEEIKDQNCTFGDWFLNIRTKFSISNDHFSGNDDSILFEEELKRFVNVDEISRKTKKEDNVKQLVKMKIVAPTIETTEFVSQMQVDDA